jgi:predicted phage terminase large subunit-like protein
LSTTSIEVDKKAEHEAMVKELMASLIKFTQIFYKARTGRRFDLSNPTGRLSHYLTICEELIKVIKGETTRLMINVPPRYGKTELVIHFIAWALARYPDSNFLYVSYSHTLAARQANTIRSIISMREYCELFEVGLKPGSTEKDNFETRHGGAVYAAGAGGTITGFGAGIKGCNRFGGAIVIDDIHKPNDIHSDTIRESVIQWYDETLTSRLNDPQRTPIIFIGQRLHEDDLAARLIKTGDWKLVVLPALDMAENALHPQMHSYYDLKKMQREQPYVYASQYQQNPIPAGGTIFKGEWFPILDDEPDIISTFETVDTAETAKSYNDASVFSFWGLYQPKVNGITIEDLWALHWIDCREVRVEPKDLEDELLNFHAGCMRYPIQPKFIAIEKKSTGVTLGSVLKRIQGLSIIDVERSKASGSKIDRFLEMQEYAARGLISFPGHARHIPWVIKHMESITGNDTHAHDDIADTAYDATKIALIDKAARLYTKQNVNSKSTDVARTIMSQFTKGRELRKFGKR